LGLLIDECQEVKGGIELVRLGSRVAEETFLVELLGVLGWMFNRITAYFKDLLG
jgi:hypothetical protein